MFEPDLVFNLLYNLQRNNNFVAASPHGRRFYDAILTVDSGSGWRRLLGFFCLLIVLFVFIERD